MVLNTSTCKSLTCCELPTEFAGAAAADAFAAMPIRMLCICENNSSPRARHRWPVAPFTRRAHRKTHCFANAGAGDARGQLHPQVSRRSRRGGFRNGVAVAIVRVRMGFACDLALGRDTAAFCSRPKWNGQRTHANSHFRLAAGIEHTHTHNHTLTYMVALRVIAASQKPRSNRAFESEYQARRDTAAESHTLTSAFANLPARKCESHIRVL